MKNYIALIFAILLHILTASAAVPAYGADHAVNLTDGIRITNALEGGNAYLLLDGNSSTGVIVESGKMLAFESTEAVSQLYLVWDTPHSAWDLISPDGESKTFGAQGFIHEYIELDTPLNNFTLEFRGVEEVLCDIYAFGEGEPPEWVQRWLPPHSEADMLLLPVHAGEEFAFFGGAIPLYAVEHGFKLQVAYMIGPLNDPPRMHKLLNGLYTAGMRNYPVMSEFPDIYAETADEARLLYDENAIIEFQVEQIRRFRPEVVLGSSIGGEYGHGVNTLFAEALLVAAEISGDELELRDSAKKYGAFDAPKTYLHLYPENKALIDWDIKLMKFGGRTALEVAREGFAAGVPWNENFRIDTSGPYDCRKFGLARSTVGEDYFGVDFFENTRLDTMRKESTKTPDAATQDAVSVSARDISDISAPKGAVPVAVTGAAAALCLIAAAALRLRKD